LTKLTKTPLDNAAFPFGAIREIGIGAATVLAARRSYVGELGWELFVPTEFAAGVYDAVMQAGAGLACDAGYYALESLRLEKFYRAWGRELSPDFTPYEAGLGFAVKLDKGDFIGRDALIAARAAPLRRRLVCFTGLSPETPLAHGGELILCDGKPVGDVTSAAFGHSLDRIVALGYVANAAPDMLGRRFELDIAGELVPVRASFKPPYDPDGARLKA
jgi:4-methylaminobutanoate oxidase (formaldehyde-forming)